MRREQGRMPRDQALPDRAGSRVTIVWPKPDRMRFATLLGVVGLDISRLVRARAVVPGTPRC